MKKAVIVLSALTALVMSACAGKNDTGNESAGRSRIETSQDDDQNTDQTCDQRGHGQHFPVALVEEHPQELSEIDRHLGAAAAMAEDPGSGFPRRSSWFPIRRCR